MDEREPGVWSLATGERSIVFADRDLETGRGALVRLHKAIPVPDKDVPLQDVLEFRERRRSELLALRYHLEQIYQRVLSAGDGELAINTELGILDRAIADHIKASKEARFKFCGVSFNASLNLIDGVKVAATTYAATFVNECLPARRCCGSSQYWPRCCPLLGKADRNSLSVCVGLLRRGLLNSEYPQPA